MNRLLLAVASVVFAMCAVFESAYAEQEVIKRPIVVISDLHMNVGHVAGNGWSPLEDFRWPKALDGFLRRVAEESPKGIDLIIAGDFLELWQHPSIECVSPRDSECGCSIAEMTQIVSEVVRGHQDVFKSLAEFLRNPSNRVYVTPGNHDAALMIPEVWKVVSDALPEGKERFQLVEGGTWVSDDGQVVIEHGHQQTYDANSFPNWPKVTMDCSGTERLFRPWGENFIQALYNEVEARLPLIDNLVPESAGLKLYWDLRGREKKRLGDVARFVVFNLLQTSVRQKLGILEVSQARTTLDEEQLKFYRMCVAEDLVTYSLPAGDSIRIALEQARDNPAMNLDGSQLRSELRGYVEKMDEPTLRALCEKALLTSGSLKATPDRAAAPECSESKSLGTMVNKIFDPEGTAVLEKRVTSLKRQYPGLTVYIFGHTHQAMLKKEVGTRVGMRLDAYNSGAFQRLMDERYFKSKAAELHNQVEALQQMTHDDLSPCYSLVFVTYSGKPGDPPKVELKQWFMSEDDASGRFLSDCDSHCSARPINCPKE